MVSLEAIILVNIYALTILLKRSTITNQLDCILLTYSILELPISIYNEAVSIA